MWKELMEQWSESRKALTALLVPYHWLPYKHGLYDERYLTDLCSNMELANSG